MWTSDSKGLKGCIRFVKPIYSLIVVDAFCYALIPSHHILGGFSGILIALWHIQATPGPLLYKSNNMANLESVLSSSIAPVFFTAFILSSVIWYGSVSAALELFGPNRYHWDNGYFSQEIEGRVSSVNSMLLNKAWEQMPEKLVLYDYIGHNPSKAGLFRSGPILKGDGLVQNWLGHPSFEIGTFCLAIVRSPAFFETFPVILIDEGGTVRADIGFRRAESLNSIEQSSAHLVLYWSGGIYHGLEYSTPSVLKDYARKAQFGEIFTFDFKTSSSDGVFRTSPRGWYSFSHTALGKLFFFGHLWHASRGVFQSLWTGLTIPSLQSVQYGSYEKYGS
jgi:photosystem II CP47 chlorophyll apoprotein